MKTNSEDNIFLSCIHGSQHHIRHPKIQHPKLKDIHKINNIEEKRKNITKKLLAKKNVSNIILSKKSKAQVNHHFHSSLWVGAMSHELKNHLVKRKHKKKIKN